MKENRVAEAREWLIIVLFTVLGAILRFWEFGRLSLTHFDEGIYAFAGLWIGEERGPLAIDPVVIPYAPPGLPTLIGLSYLAFGTSDFSAILVATLCGIATIPVVGWLGRRTFGPGAGACASVFAALSLAHIAFSRKVLTDAPFLLAWLVAVSLGGRFLEKPMAVRAIGFGLSVGIAQYFKYNGWLVAAIVALTVVSGVLPRREERRLAPLLQTLGWGLVSVTVAAIVYAPWYGFVSSHGGYGALIRHHSSYVGGLPSWWPNWTTQMAEASSLAGTRTWGVLIWCLAVMSGWLAAYGLTLGHPSDRGGVVRLIAGMGIGAVVLTFQPNAPWWVGLGWLPWLSTSNRRSVRLLGIWWALMSVLTPFYHPYARLWLPIHAVGWILVGGIVSQFLGTKRSKDAESGVNRTSRLVSRRARVLGPLGVGITCLGLSALLEVRAIPVPWSRILQPDSSRTMRAFVFSYLPSVSDLRGKTLRVWGRRPLAFYLVQQGRFPIQLEPGLGRLIQLGTPRTWSVVDEAMLIQEGNKNDVLSNLLQYWRPEWPFGVEIDPITLLDIDPTSCRTGVERELNLWLMSPRMSPGPPPVNRWESSRGANAR